MLNDNFSLPGGNSITNAYGNAGELLATALLHGTTLLDFAKYSYDDNGNRTSVTRANNVYVNYAIMDFAYNSP